GQAAVVLHGLLAVAALKRPPSMPGCHQSGCSPRPAGRGRIEAFSVSLPNPKEFADVLHGLLAVAALKPAYQSPASSACWRSPRPAGRGRIEAPGAAGVEKSKGVVLHGLLAVAALKRCQRATRGSLVIKFSTACWPWPH